VTPILQLKPEERLVRSYLERALDASSPSVVGLRLVQRFANETPDLFCNAALTLLESEEDSSALRFMTVKLLRQPRLIEMLSDPVRLDKTASIRLFRLLMQHDRSLDIRLAQSLPDRFGASQIPVTPEVCGRALDVLDEVSVGRRIVPILGHLVDHPFPWLSAKATLVVGRRVQSVSWAKRLLTDDRNSRDRANALEALWGLDTQEARALLWEHSLDKNNRVTGNAVFGLHIVGESKAGASVVRMAQRIEPDFRWTSAWLMAKIQRDEHITLLKQMIKDENPGVRRAVLKALVGIRQEQVLKQAEERRLSTIQETLPEASTDQAEAPAPDSSHAWRELAPDPGPPPEPEHIAMRDFNLRLDGRSFSFRDR